MAVVNRTQRPSMFLGTFDLKEIDNKFALSEDTITNTKHGGRIILPSSVLRRIVAVDAPSPFIMKIQLLNSKIEIYCGVQSFDGKEREVLAPRWICDHIKASKNSRVKVFILNRRLASGTLAKFKPLSTDFFSVMNPKKVLESSLSHYTCLNVNNTIDISFIDKVYKLTIVHLEPETLVDITNCDLEVEFETIQENEVNEEDVSQPQTFTAFSGQCNRLDGKELSSKQKKDDQKVKKITCKIGTPDYKYEMGTVKMHRKATNTADAMYNKLKRVSTEGEQIVGKRKSTRISLQNSESNSQKSESSSKRRKVDET